MFECRKPLWPIFALQLVAYDASVSSHERAGKCRAARSALTRLNKSITATAARDVPDGPQTGDFEDGENANVRASAKAIQYPTAPFDIVTPTAGQPAQA